LKSPSVLDNGETLKNFEVCVNKVKGRLLDGGIVKIGNNDVGPSVGLNKFGLRGQAAHRDGGTGG
jgi:hypothetical protein